MQSSGMVLKSVLFNTFGQQAELFGKERRRRKVPRSGVSRLCPRGAKQLITVQPLTPVREPLIMGHFDDLKVALARLRQPVSSHPVYFLDS
ncbi:hypothetical protein M0804_011855 [Polistes exclamans]|nr:hypothetical protein M0804_011855 [Polistes exclamans]